MRAVCGADFGASFVSFVSFEAGAGELEEVLPGEDVSVFWDVVDVPVVGEPAGAAPVVLELAVFEPVVFEPLEFAPFVEGVAGAVAGFSSSLSLLSDPACR